MSVIQYILLTPFQRRRAQSSCHPHRVDSDVEQTYARRCSFWSTGRSYSWYVGLTFFTTKVVDIVIGMLAWMIGCWKIYGESVNPCQMFGMTANTSEIGKINIPNLANPYSAVCSGLTGLLFSGLISVGVSLLSM